MIDLEVQFWWFSFSWLKKAKKCRFALFAYFSWLKNMATQLASCKVRDQISQKTRQADFIGTTSKTGAIW